MRNLEFCDDTLSAIRCIETLGARVTRIGADALAIDGGLRQADISDGMPTGTLCPTSDTLRTGESGLATRLFTPIASLADRPMHIVGEGSLLHRPMEPMIATLRHLGVRVEDNDGRLPLTVCGPLQGGETSIDGSISSQFITGLLLALPLAQKDTVLHVAEPVSIPSVSYTHLRAHET